MFNDFILHVTNKQKILIKWITRYFLSAEKKKTINKHTNNSYFIQQQILSIHKPPVWNSTIWLKSDPRSAPHFFFISVATIKKWGADRGSDFILWTQTLDLNCFNPCVIYIKR
jgi:hypothetical protein